jgi:serine/threonine-protein kinase
MATVFVAEQDAEPREVALKILRAELTADKTFAKRFEREAKAAARVQHPNSVTIVDAGVEGSISYIAMELLRGDDLYTLLERHSVLSPRAAATIVAEVCEALAVAHGLGIVHRDLKPENIMIVHDPAAPPGSPSAGPLPPGARVKVLDFGIAKLLDKQGDGGPKRDDRLDPPSAVTAVTRAGTLIGTPAYMSPEQVRCEPLDARSDLYAVAVVLHEFIGLEHYLSHRADNLAVLLEAVETEIPACRGPGAYANPHQGPPPIELQFVVGRGLQKDPRNRYQSAGEMLAGIRAYLEGRGEVRCVFSFTKRAVRESGHIFDRHPRLGLALYFGIIGLALVGLVALLTLLIS